MFFEKKGESIMKNCKNRQAFIFMMVLSVLGFSSVSFAMSSSMRRMGGPAMGSGIRYSSGSVGPGVVSNISVSSYAPSQQFTPMPQQPVSYAPKKNRCSIEFKN